MPDSSQQPEKSESLTPSEIESLLSGGLTQKSSEPNDKIKDHVRTLILQVLSGDLRSGDLTGRIEEIIAQLDRKISEQTNAIIHHPDFQKLEGTWRGLEYLVRRAQPPDDMVKIRVFNISKKELGDTLRPFAKSSQWDQNPLFKRIYEEEMSKPDGQPFGTIIGDYYFGHSPPDVEILRGMAQISAAAHAPFVTAASPTLMNMDSWQELAAPRDLYRIFQTPDYAAWNSLRASDDSRYLALTMPRFLSRLPYGPNTNPVDKFFFEEDTEGPDQDKFVWCNSAYAFAGNVARAFKVDGWCARISGIESGGIVEGLPCYAFPTADGGVDVKCPTEIAITERREFELFKLGLMPLLHWKNTDFAVFVGAHSLQKPVAYTDPAASANAELAARLSHLYPVCRFAQYLEYMCRDRIGSLMEGADLERQLNDWIQTYVSADPQAADEMDPRYPLTQARITIDEIPGQPGYYQAVVHIQPHYQLERLTASMAIRLSPVRGNSSP
ncbi:MAG: type VI secretion system contractile sheath large subunit [Verrucomicrobiia bacterium]